MHTFHHGLVLCFALLASSLLGSAKEEHEFGGDCDVSATSSAITSKTVNSKIFDCSGMCPEVDYGSKIFQACCDTCDQYTKQGPGYFGLCRGCSVTATEAEIAAYVTQGLRRRLNASKPADLTSKTYTASCKAGVGDQGNVPRIQVKKWPCGPCKDIPIAHRQCCADCTSLAAATPGPTFWQCETCDTYQDRTGDIKRFVLDAAELPESPSDGCVNNFTGCLVLRVMLGLLIFVALD